MYTPTGEIEEPELEFFLTQARRPRGLRAHQAEKRQAGHHYQLLRGQRAGPGKETDYSYGNVESARLCMKPLADYMGVSVEECARQILDKAYEKIKPVIEEFAEKYRIEKDQITLVGVGGGAAALLPYTAKEMQLNYSIPKYAEVISSIGVALAMVRDVVERVIPNPTTEDIRQLKRGGDPGREKRRGAGYH